MISITHEDGVFVCRCDFEERAVPKDAGFRWEPNRKFWWTRAADKANQLSNYADERCKAKLEALMKATDQSQVLSSDIYVPAPPGLQYYPFQLAGIDFMKDRGAVLLADQMGCLSGDTLINFYWDRAYVPTTLQKAYTLFRANHTTLIETTSLVDGRLTLNTVKNIVAKGVQNVVRLRLITGKELIMTPDHKVYSMSLMAWVAIDKLRTGDTIYTESIIGFISVLRSDTIVSIDTAGKTDVYDITMESPANNFVANGIIVHNCGKTIQVAGLINLVKDLHKILVICPASLKLNWKRELDKWLTRKLSISIISNGKVYNDADIVVINYDLLSKHYADLRKQTWDLRVVDEAHFIKSNKAARSKNVFGKWSTKTKNWELTPIPAKRKIMITGTPIVNRPVELWPLIRSLDPETWNSYKEYVFRYCAAKQSGCVFDVSGASNLKELGSRLRASGIFLRRLKKDVLKDLPDVIRQIIEIEPDAETKKLIQRELQEWESRQTKLSELQKAVERSKARKDEEYAELVGKLKETYKIAFEEMSKVRHDTAVRKIPVVIEHINGILEEKEKIVVFAHHKDVVDALEKAFPASVSLVGSTPLQKRQENIDKFQTDPKCRVFIGNIIAAGVGITLTAADMVVFAELDWVPSNISQCEARLARIGQKNSVIVHHLVYEGSIDAKMAKTIVRKQNNINQVLKIS